MPTPNPDPRRERIATAALDTWRKANQRLNQIHEAWALLEDLRRQAQEDELEARKFITVAEYAAEMKAEADAMIAELDREEEG